MSVKKAELHVHLEGTMPPTLAQTIAKRNNIELPHEIISADNQGYLSQDFLHFLGVFDLVANVVKKPIDYYDITFNYLRERAEENAIYVEMMYSPDHAEQASGIPSIEHLHAIEQAIHDAEAEFDIVGRIIIVAVRHFGVEAVTRVAKQIAKESVGCVTGFGLGGDEVNFPPCLFTKAYQIASDAGLRCTVHAGEHASASTMVDAMHCLPIERIGHGVQAVHSREVMAMLKDQDIALEICPSSNFKLGLFKGFNDHPLPTLLDEGIKISLNSDDPPFMGTTLGHEYDLVQQAYHYDDGMMESITAMAIERAFVDDEIKTNLLKKLKQGCTGLASCLT